MRRTTRQRRSHYTSSTPTLKNNSEIGNISPYDWKTTPKDYKSIIKGQRYVLTLDPETGGTVMRPVNILKKELYVKKKKLDIQLIDDGSLDTVVSVNGKEMRYDQEFASMFRNRKSGAFTDKGWRELKKQAENDYYDQYGDNE